LLDVVVEQKKLYLVFEFLNKDLKGYIDELKEKKKAMDHLLLKKLMLQLISGVAKIHEKRIVHRDLKPANILLDKDRTIFVTQ
jgi:serine/threonine protein kinase